MPQDESAVERAWEYFFRHHRYTEGRPGPLEHISRYLLKYVFEKVALLKLLP